MSFRKQSAVRHISWIELMDMCDSIVGQLKFGPRINSICPVDTRSEIPARIIAYKLDIPVDRNGLTFGITSELRPKACFFQLESENEFVNNEAKTKIETIPVDIEGEYQKITMPWEKR